jgi:site-specific recombinase XerD
MVCEMAKIIARNLRASEVENISDLSDSYDQFVFSRSIGNCSKGTIRFYRDKKNVIVSWFSDHGYTDLVDLTPNDIRQFLSDYRSGHTDPGTFKIFAVFRTFLNWYWDEYDLQIRNPITKIKMARKESEPKAGITLQEIEAMLKAAETTEFPERDRTIVLMLADTGIRKTGFCSLRFKDLDLDRGEIRVYGKNQKWSTKQLGTNARKALRKYVSMIEDYKPDDLIWLTRDGEPLTQSGVREILRRLQRVNGIEKTHEFHAFRRFYGLSLYNETHDIYFVSRMLDHSNIEVTKRYLDIKQEDDLAKASKLSPMDKRKA